MTEKPHSSEPIRFRPRQEAEIKDSLNSCVKYCLFAQKMLAGKLPLQKCQMTWGEQCLEAYDRLVEDKILDNPDIIDGR